MVNKVTEICFIAPTNKLALKAKRIISKRKNNIDVYVASLDGAKNLCERLIRNGAKIIISRKGTKALIENSFDIKVVGINTILSDYINIMRFAKDIDGPIGFFSYEELSDDIKTMCQLLNIDARHYRFTNDEDSERCIEQAVADGVKLGIGGVVTEKYARKYNLNHVIVENSEESIINAIETAMQLLFIRNEEIKKQEKLKIKLERYEAIFNYTHDGIIAVDENGNITILNREAEIIIKEHDYYGKSIESVIPGTNVKEILKTGEIQLNQLMNIKGTIVNSNRIPIVVDKEIKGVVVTFQNIEIIQKSEMEIRKKIHSKGFVAKYSIDDIIGKSDAIMKAKKLAKIYAKLNSTILLFGETGTGKELFAQSIHNLSNRKSANFVAVNCATLPRNLLESELFGYVEGAFTGASKGGKAGLFELAHKGTIFLDEITELPLDIQGQLLRVLQEKEIRRIGSDIVTPVDIRIIAATNKPLEREVENNKFRKDLYYRINILNIMIPALRERKEDIEPIAINMFKKYSGTYYKDHMDVLKRILNSIDNYNWPGNVRELNNFVERVSALIEHESNDDIIQSVVNELLNDIEDINEMFYKKDAENYKTDEKEPDLSHWEYGHIIDALKKNQLKITKTAEYLGISRSTLNRKIKKYNIKL